MKTLLILRHAKSSWKHPELSDHDRPLNKRGKHDAPLMGSQLKKRKLIPDLIISSTAIRAKETALVVAQAVGCTEKIILLPSLYAASPSVYIQAISETADDKNYSIVLVVGHNPGLEELIEVLTGDFQQLSTCALAIIELPIEKWSILKQSHGKLVECISIKH